MTKLRGVGALHVRAWLHQMNGNIIATVSAATWADEIGLHRRRAVDVFTDTLQVVCIVDKSTE